MKRGQSNVLEHFMKEDIMQNVRHLNVLHCYESEMFPGVSMMDLEQCDTSSTPKGLDSLFQCCSFDCWWHIDYERQCFSCQRRDFKSFEYKIQLYVNEKAQPDGNSCCHKWLMFQEILR